MSFDLTFILFLPLKRFCLAARLSHGEFANQHASRWVERGGLLEISSAHSRVSGNPVLT
jgi:hypothetical protein